MTWNWLRSVGAFAGGVMVANSAPHLASAATGRGHMVPLAGRGASPRLNLAWGGANLLAGLLVTAGGVRRGPRSWDSSLLLFEAGAAALSVWMLASESLLHLNTGGATPPP